MAEVGVVVDGELRVDGQQPAVLRHDQRVDLGQRAVVLDEGLREALDQRDGRPVEVAVEAGREGQPARLVALEAARRVDRLAVDLLGVLLGDLLDLHPAGRRGDQHRPPGRVVDHRAEVELAVDVDLLLDEHGVHGLAAGALDGDELRAEQRLRGGARLLDAVGELDPAGLAASAGVDLRLHHHLAAELLGGGGGLVGGAGDLAARHGHAVAGEQLLGLVFVQLHRGLPVSGTS